MNKSLLVLNMVLLAGVAVLFYLFFDNRKSNGASSKMTGNGDTSATGGGFRVAYFDMDSIESNFSLFKEMQAEVTKKEDSMNTVLNTVKMNFQSKYQKYQAQGATMTPEQMEAARIDLSNTEMDIKNREATLNQTFQTFYMNKQQEVITKIKKYCEEYNRDKKYSIILVNEPGLIYYKDTALNITSALLKGLNERYGTKKKE